MIDKISNWTEGIIIAVIIVTLVEMLIPNKSNNKKYIQMVGGLYIMFAIISPIISTFSSADNLEEKMKNYEQFFEIENSIEVDSKKIEEMKESQTEEIYSLSLKENIDCLIKENGFIASDIEIKLNENNIEEIKLKVNKAKSNKVKKVNIHEESNDVGISEAEKNTLKSLISLQYGVSKEKIELY